MKISYLMYEPVPDLAELDRRMARIAELGYTGIELTATSPLGYEIEQLVELSQEHRLPVVSLLSGWSYANERLCLSSPDAMIRRRAVERLEDYIRYAAALQAVVVVGLMQGLRIDEPDEKIANAHIVVGLKKASAVAAQANVTLVLEPVNHMQVGFNHTAEEVADIVHRVGSPAVGYMLDTLHMNIEERSVVETIRQFGSGMRHFHLCETNGGPFGTGGLDFPRVLQTLRDIDYSHHVSVKIYRKAGWEAAATSAAEFLYQLGYWERENG